MALYITFAVSLIFLQSAKLSLLLISVSLLILTLSPDRRMRIGKFPILFLVMMTFAGNLFFFHGRVLFEAGPLTITDLSLKMALLRSSKVFGLIVGAKLLTLTTPLDDIIKLLGRLFLPLEAVRVPVRDFFETLSMTIKLLPGIREEALKNYRSGLAGAGEKGLLKRAGILISLVFPVMVRTLQAPPELAAVRSNDFTEEREWE